MKNNEKVFNPGRVLLVILSMVILVASMAVLFSLASCSQEVPHEHSWGEGEITTVATCTTAGERTFTCECGETKTEVIPALGHDYSTEWTIDTPANCTTDGSKSHHCSRCESKIDVTPIPAAHTWDEGEITTPATCTEPGEKLLTCTACSATITETIPAGHTFSTDWKFTTTEHWHQATCEHTDQVSDKAEHIYGEGVVTKQPTCTLAGTTEYTCVVCGYTKKDPKTPHILAHTPGENHTCTVCGWFVPFYEDSVGGWVYYDCDFDNTAEDPDGEDNLKSDVCGWRYLVAAPADLRVVNGVPTVDATAPGYDEASKVYVFGYKTTSKPDYISTSKEIGTGAENTAKLINDMGDSAYIEMETDAEKTSDYAASLCDRLVYDGFDDWFLPSRKELNTLYLNRGNLDNWDYSDNYWSSTEYSSINTTYTYSEGAPSLPRGNRYIIRPVRMILEIGHAIEAVEAVSSSCEAGHIAHYKCSVCGKLFSDEAGTTEITAESIVIPAAHAWNEGEVTEDPAFMHDGEITYTCTACSETKTEVISRGAGTEEDPYLITSAADWNAFADYTVSEKCIGLYFKLTDDISVTKMASAYISSSTMPFRGEFDGDGHTITLSLDSSELAGGGKEWNDGLALFMSVGDGCVIKNLTVTGTITTTRKFAAGFTTRVVDSATVVFENCRSNVTINSSVSGDTTTAGFVAVVKDNSRLILDNCLFDGNFISENGKNFSGLVGYMHIGTLSLSDCAVTLGGETTESLKTEPGSVTFFRNDTGAELILSGSCLYTTVLGNDNFCTQASEISTGEYTIEKTICGKKLYVKPISSLALAGSGTETDPYVISSSADWDIFCALSRYDSFEKKFIKLENDVEITGMAAINPAYPFRGTFEGNGKTLTVTLQSGDNTHYNSNDESTTGVAPILIAGDGCVIRNLRTTGTITASRKFAAGILSYILRSNSNEIKTFVVLENCSSDVTITSSVSGDATGGGLVALAGRYVILTVRDCLFEGTIIDTAGGEKFSGLIGFQSKFGKATIEDCAVILGENTTSALMEDATNNHTLCRNSGTADYKGIDLYVDALGNTDGAVKAYLSQADAEAAGKTVGTKTIAGRTLYYVTEAAE